jgi:hypothetical protein
LDPQNSTLRIEYGFNNKNDQVKPVIFKVRLSTSNQNRIVQISLNGGISRSIFS